MDTVVDGIALQTNLLALKAAIDAAGVSTQQGRGCAVVVFAVLGLARRDGTAAHEIKPLNKESSERFQQVPTLKGTRGATAINGLIGELRAMPD